jgi:hypothetical protein
VGIFHCVDVVYLIRQSEKLMKSNSENMDARATKADLLAMKDRLSVLTQQSVAASMSAWHDKIESSVCTLFLQ